MVIDLEKNAVAGEIHGHAGGHSGFVAAPEAGLGFSTNGKEDKIESVVGSKDAQNKREARQRHESVRERLRFEARGSVPV